MRKRFLNSILVLAVALALMSVVRAQTGGQQSAGAKTPAGSVPVRDFSGVWLTQGGPGGEGPGGDEPPMTPWAKAKYDANKPGYGPKAAPGGNDPILQCDPMGYPRVMYFLLPMEFANVNGRVVMFFEREHTYREIWTDGRKLPDDPDPSWYGTAVGKWEDDYTLAVNSNGYDERTWLGANGQPHSDEMKLTERYHRVDRDTIEFNLTIDDPKAYTKPWVVAQRVLKLRPKAEINQLFCVWSEENAFNQRIRMPAAAPKPNGQK